MLIHRNFDSLPPIRRPAATIGSYDGVHAGHRAILGRIADIARERGGESVVVTFDPHPRSGGGKRARHAAQYVAREAGAARRYGDRPCCRRRFHARIQPSLDGGVRGARFGGALARRYAAGRVQSSSGTRQTGRFRLAVGTRPTLGLRCADDASAGCGCAQGQLDGDPGAGGRRQPPATRPAVWARPIF